MASRHVDEYDERSAIKRSYSAELGSAPNSGKKAHSSGIAKRYIIAVFAFLGFANVYSLRVNLSVAIVAMTSNYTLIINGTSIQRRDFDWNPATQGLVLSSFFYGYIITQLPGGWLARRLGAKYVLGVGILATGVLSILTPPVARLNLYLLVALRVLEGLFEGVTYPCIHAIMSKWAPPLERSKLTTIAFSGSYFGTVVALPLSGIIADSLGWSWIFYIFGMLAVVWFFFWIWIVMETPESHPTISQSELEYIQQSIGFKDDQVKDQPVPWKDLFLSLPVWAIIMAHFAENWGFYTMLTELPTYLNDTMSFNLQKSGFLAAIPYVIMVISVQVGGQMADLVRKKEWLSTTNVRKVFNVTAFSGQALFMIGAAYVSTPVAAVVCISFGVGFGGFSWSGFGVNHLDIAPQFASILFGISNLFATIPGIVSPLLTGHIVNAGGKEEWRVVFFLASGIYTAGAVFYLLFGSGRLQPWAEIPLGFRPHVESRAVHGHGEVDEVEDEH